MWDLKKKIFHSNITSVHTYKNLLKADYGTLVQPAVYSVSMVYCFFDIFMVMYFGNEIRLSSDRLSYCLFESDWIDQSKSFKQHMLILTEVLKQPEELVIGKIYPLNLSTFTSVSWNCFNLFNSVMSTADYTTVIKLYSAR